MPRAKISYGLITSQNQGGGNKKQGLPPTVGLGHFSMNIIQRKAGYCRNCVTNTCDTTNYTQVDLSQYCSTNNAGGIYTTLVQLNTLYNDTTSTFRLSPYYLSFPELVTTLVRGQTYALIIKVSGGVYSGAIASVWIDWYQTYSYNSSDWTQIGTNIALNTQTSVNITVPEDATIGQTGMRIRTRGSNNINGSTNSCTSMGSGDTQDYPINIC
jgi:hypothetical protein